MYGMSSLRNNTFFSRKTIDGPSSDAWEFLQGSQERIADMIKFYKKLDSYDKNEMRDWAKRKGYPAVLKFMDAFGLR